METPIFTRTWEPQVGPDASSTSALLMYIFTGAPDFRESAAATGCRYVASLPPNPPPISSGTTFILDTGTPNTVATVSRMPKCPWLEHQTVILPSGFQYAVAF